MGYIPQFKNDLFISYRRASNEAHDSWVDAFCNQLHAVLRDLVGDVSIWRDQGQLRTGQQWRNEVVEALDGTAIFLAIISRTYLDSDECRRELDRFLGWLKDPARGSGRKIVPIFKHPPKPDQELPQEMGQIHRHDFFRLDPPGTTRFREFSPNDDKDREFWESLGRVAQDIMVALEELRGIVQQRAIGKVFVARASPELQLERERLRSDLLQRGYHVVPEQEYLWNADNHRAVIAKDLDGAKLCIHLVGSSASIESAASAHVKLQIELAHEAMKRAGRPAPMVWIQPAKEVDKSVRELVDYIRCDLANEGVEYSEGGLEDFKTHIYDRLPPPPPPAPAARVREIALLVEEGDIGDLGALKALMVEKLALEPNTIKFAGSAPKDQMRLARTLSGCEQCVIFWARQAEEWVLDLLASEALAAHLGRGRMCIYAAAPLTPEKASFHSAKARIILAADGPNEADLQVFFGANPIAA